MAAMHLRRAVLSGATMVLLAGVIPLSGARADSYPDHSIKLIIPLAPGSSVDTLARALSTELGPQLHQAIVVENHPGAEGIIATELVKNAKPDGYTLLMVYPGHAMNVHLYKKLPYDTIKDFTPIAQVATNLNVLVVADNSPFKTAGDLIAAIKAKPETLNFGNAGGTSGGSGDLLNFMAGLKATEITYNGATQSLTDLLGGRIDYMFTAMSSATPLVHAGKLRALAVTGTKRDPSMPNVPTMAEFVPNFETTGWYGLAGPAGLPPNVVAVVNKAVMDSLKSPVLQARLAAIGFSPAAPNTPAEFDTLIRSEIVKWSHVGQVRD
jgi:tripartite-type tricarboxylate transporter receptor subunit TctC